MARVGARGGLMHHDDCHSVLCCMTSLEGRLHVIDDAPTT